MKLIKLVASGKGRTGKLVCQKTGISPNWKKKAIGKALEIKLSDMKDETTFVRKYAPINEISDSQELYYYINRRKGLLYYMTIK